MLNKIKNQRLNQNKGKSSLLSIPEGKQLLRSSTNINPRNVVNVYNTLMGNDRENAAVFNMESKQFKRVNKVKKQVGIPRAANRLQTNLTNQNSYVGQNSISRVAKPSQKLTTTRLRNLSPHFDKHG